MSFTAWIIVGVAALSIVAHFEAQLAKQAERHERELAALHRRIAALERTE